MIVFWYIFARTGVFVSAGFVVFDAATHFLGGVIWQSALLVGYALAWWSLTPAYRRHRRIQEIEHHRLELEGDELQRRINELERELGIGGER
jgi:hypothetical protein